jgi:two-component system, chemotaxis family, CheB/CheR fusion protein
VDAQSGGLGAGTEFRIALPLESGAVGVESSYSSRLNVPPRRVLVIEDNVDAADMLRAALELGGHVVDVAHDGMDGLRRARAFQPDVVLCDVGLPGVTGYEVARSLRADPELRSTILVALTGYALPEDLTRAREAGFDLHLAKPLDLDVLQRVLAAAQCRG